jgi:hypothetical protein
MFGISEMRQDIATLKAEDLLHRSECENIKRDVARIETTNREGFNTHKANIAVAQKEIDALERKIEAYEAQARTLKNVGSILAAGLIFLFGGVQALMKSYITELENTISKQTEQISEQKRRVDETERLVERMISPAPTLNRGNPRQSDYLQIADPVGGDAVPEFTDVHKMRLIFRGRVTRWPDGTPVTLIILSNDLQMENFAWDTLRISPQKFRDDIAMARAQGRVSVKDADTVAQVISKLLNHRGGIGFVPNAQIYRSTTGITILVVDE